MKTLTKEEILAAQDLKTETVDVPEWGGQVIVRTMTGLERDRFESSIMQGGQRNYENLRSKVVVSTVVDAEGNSLFTLKDVEALGKKAANVIDRVFTVAIRLSGMTGKEMEELAGNSSTGPSDASTSD